MENSDEENLVDSLIYQPDKKESCSNQLDSNDLRISNQSERNDLTSTTLEPHMNRKGRHKIPFTKKFQIFYYGKNNKNPKKEYISTSIIRAIKKGFRFIKNGNTPIKSCIAIDIKCDKESRIWDSLRAIYRENPEIIEEIAFTKDGDNHKCHTNSYCKKFFSNIYMQKAFHKLIELIFNDYSCSACSNHTTSCIFYCSLCCSNYCSRCCSRFKFYCCNNGKNSVHNRDCLSKWHKISKYFSKYYLKELKVEILPEEPSIYLVDQELVFDSFSL